MKVRTHLRVAKTKKGIRVAASSKPSYLPLMTAARELGEGRLAMDTDVKGSSHTVEAWWRLDADRRRIDWGSERDPGYHGWLVVEPAGSGAGSQISYELTTPRDHTLEPYLRAATTFLATALAARA